MNINPFKLSEGEYSLADIVWREEPVKSSELARLCLENMNWKKSTVYTMLKRLENKGVLRNDNAIVTSKVAREQVEQYISSSVVKNTFKGSLPGFVAAFLKEQKLCKEEIEELYQMIRDAEGGSGA